MKLLINLFLILSPILLILINPFDSDSRVVYAFYCMPLLVYAIYHYTEVYSTKSLRDSEKRLILYEQILSIARKGIAILSILILSGLSNSIPGFNMVSNALKYFAENFGAASEAIEVLIGFVLMLVSHFYKFDRFESRIINPRKINL